MYRNIVRPTFIYIFAHIWAYEKSLIEEDALIALFAVRGRPFGVQMVETEVFYISCIRPSA